LPPRTTRTTVPGDAPAPPIRALSLGAGALVLLLSAHGVLPALDCAAFAEVALPP
jgi:hypothetical protein